jgi:hypothetical protein
MLNSIGSGQNKGGIERKEGMKLRKDEPLQKKVAEEESDYGGKQGRAALSTSEQLPAPSSSRYRLI